MWALGCRAVETKLADGSIANRGVACPRPPQKSQSVRVKQHTTQVQCKRPPERHLFCKRERSQASRDGTTTRSDDDTTTTLCTLRTKSVLFCFQCDMLLRFHQLVQQKASALPPSHPECSWSALSSHARDTLEVVKALSQLNLGQASPHSRVLIHSTWKFNYFES